MIPSYVLGFCNLQSGVVALVVHYMVHTDCLKLILLDRVNILVEVFKMFYYGAEKDHLERLQGISTVSDGSFQFRDAWKRPS